MNLDDCEHYLGILKNSVDQNWLQNEFDNIDRYYKTPKNARVLGEPEDILNPLAFLIFRAQIQIHESQANPSVLLANEAISTTLIGMYIEPLKKANVEGFEEKINALTRADKNQFEKIIFELNITYHFIAKHKVKFIETKPEEQETTPDLLVDDSIEIECKKKDRLSPRDIKNDDSWRILERKLAEFMNLKKKFYFVYIYFKKDPNLEIRTEILRNIKKIVNSNSKGKFEFTDYEITIYKICDQTEKFILNFKAKDLPEFRSALTPQVFDDIIKQRAPVSDLLDYQRLQPDFDHTLHGVCHFSDGRVAIAEIMKFLFKTKDPPDRLTSITNSIERATKEQLSGERCGIVCVGISNIIEKLKETDKPRLIKMIEYIMRNNSSLSAVVLTADKFLNVDGKLRVGFDYQTIKNNSAKYPVPENFVFSNK